MTWPNTFAAGWSAAREAAARVADFHSKATCTGLGDETAGMRFGARSIAAGIRSLTPPAEPVPVVTEEMVDVALAGWKSDASTSHAKRMRLALEALIQHGRA